MTPLRIAAIALPLIFVGCDEQPAPAAKAEPAAKAAPAANAAAEPRAHGDDAKSPANPHGDAKAPTDPHAGPMAGGTPAAPKGPPRDITPSGELRTEKAAELSFGVPSEWETLAVKSPMRVAQFVVPGPGGDAEMVVFRFAGGAGGIDANIARWKGQFVAPEGKTVDDLTKTTNFEAGALKVTLVDISGRYNAPAMPGGPEMVDATDQRMIAAIIEGAGDPFFFKLLGAEKTIALWAKPFEDGLRAAKTG